MDALPPLTPSPGRLISIMVIRAEGQTQTSKGWWGDWERGPEAEEGPPESVTTSIMTTT